MGTEIPPSETTRSTWSVGRFLRIAAITPNPIPNTAATTIEKSASSAVAGMKLARSLRTEACVCCRLAQVALREMRRDTARMRTGSGLSSP